MLVMRDLRLARPLLFSRKAASCLAPVFHTFNFCSAGCLCDICRRSPPLPTPSTADITKLEGVLQQPAAHFLAHDTPEG